MKRRLALFLLAAVASSCHSSERDSLTAPRSSVDVRTAVGENGPSLQLSWQALGDSLSSYHIFYVKGDRAREIDSLVPTDPDFRNPKLTIDGRNMESWPEKGSKACFYVIAENKGLFSDPSDLACATM